MYCKCYLNLHPAFVVSKDYTSITLEDIMVKTFVCCITILLGLISSSLAAKQIRVANPNPKDSFGAARLPEKSSITAAPLNEIFGAQGESKDGMLKFTFGRPATMHGVKIGKDMGVNTWAAFAGSDDNAVVDGDFAVTEDELQPVLKSLLKDKINIVAIHQHMTHEQPRMMFFHYWGRGSAKDLAQAVKGGTLVGGLLKISSPIP